MRMMMSVRMVMMMMMRRRRRMRRRIIIGTEPRTTLCASLHSPNACPHVTRDIRRATLYGIYRKIFAAQTGPRTWTHFVRACAVEMHVHTSQESEEPLYRKMPQPRLGRTQTNTLCEPAQSKCMSTCHKSQKGHFILKFTGKMPRPRLGPECRQTLCASLRNRNACQDLRETSEEPLCTEIYRKNPAAQIGPRMQTHILCEPAQSKRMPGFHKSHFIRNLQVKCRRPE